MVVRYEMRIHRLNQIIFNPIDACVSGEGFRLTSGNQSFVIPELIETSSGASLSVSSSSRPLLPPLL